jgi:hypothetical protein
MSTCHLDVSLSGHKTESPALAFLYVSYRLRPVTAIDIHGDTHGDTHGDSHGENPCHKHQHLPALESPAQHPQHPQHPQHSQHPQHAQHVHILKVVATHFCSPGLMSHHFGKSSLDSLFSLPRLSLQRAAPDSKLSARSSKEL